MLRGRETSLGRWNTWVHPRPGTWWTDTAWDHAETPPENSSQGDSPHFVLRAEKKYKMCLLLVRLGAKKLFVKINLCIICNIWNLRIGFVQETQRWHAAAGFFLEETDMDNMLTRPKSNKFKFTQFYNFWLTSTLPACITDRGWWYASLSQHQKQATVLVTAHRSWSFSDKLPHLRHEATRARRQRGSRQLDEGFRGSGQRGEPGLTLRLSIQTSDCLQAFTLCHVTGHGRHSLQSVPTWQRAITNVRAPTSGVAMLLLEGLSHVE